MIDQRADNAQRTEVIGLLNRALDRDLLTLDDYDTRVAAVGAATYASELLAALQDLPPGYAWHPQAAGVGTPARPAATKPASGRSALVLGIASLPLSICLVGGVLGAVAVVLSLRGERPGRGLSAALLGRVFGIVGILLSLGALFAALFAVRRS
jgi:hypothetical protein